MLAGEDLRLSNPARHHAHSFTVQIAAAADSDLQAKRASCQTSKRKAHRARLQNHQQ